MYPFPFSLSFTEHMYFPSMLVYLIALVTNSSIAQFNILALANHLLLYISFYFLAGRFTKNSWIKVIAGLFVAFSPYILSQIGHFQMIFFWPFILCLYFLFHPDRQIHHFMLTGLFLAWQFMSSVYLGIMGMAAIILYYAVRFINPHLFPVRSSTKKELEKNRKGFFFGFYTAWDKRSTGDRFRILSEIVVIFVVFLVIAEPTISAYLEMYQTYKPVIDQGQYVTYAAHISDYFFTSGQNSLLYQLTKFWSKFDNHLFGEKAAFVGIVPIVVIGYWFVSIWKKRVYLSLDSHLPTSSFGLRRTSRGNDKKFSESGMVVWLLWLMVIAFIFSLGPRLNWNGTYLVYPLPYLFILKLIPLIGVMRATARWYFLFVLSISMLFVFSMQYISLWIYHPLLKKVIFPLLFCAVLIEFYPAPIPASSQVCWSTSYTKVKEICQENPAPLLEYPFDYRAQDRSVIKDLNYKTKILLASTRHTCDILSGFSGYTPKKYSEYRDFLQDHEFNRGGLKLLHDLGFRYVKLNFFAMNAKEKKQIAKFITFPYVKKIYEDKDVTIIELRKLTKYEMSNDPLLK